MTQLNHQRQSTDHGHKNSTELTQAKPKNRWPVLFLIILGAVAVNVLLVLKSKENPDVLAPATLRAIGPETALVTITEFADFGCISCKAWHQFGIREKIIERYGEQVRFVWRDFPVTTPQSPRAAEAGFCAFDQDAFWAYHDILYANAPKFSDHELESYAVEIGLDSHRFNACLESGEHRGSVERERSTALDKGLRSVPSFLVNEQRLIGPPSFDQLVTIIDEILLALD